MNFLHLDLETRSAVDIANGVYRYVECPHADALLGSYAFDESPDTMRRWRRGQPCPQDIAEHVARGLPIKAFNAAFERIMWRDVLGPKHGWPVPRLEQFHCTAVTAAAMSLPRSLDRLAQALDLPAQKDKRGKTLIKLLSIPQGFTEAGEPIWYEDLHSAEDFAKLIDELHDYCDQDVRTEMAADRRLIPLSDREHDIYVLNEEINDRGIRIDVQSARAALQIVEKAKARIDAELYEVTDRTVEKVTQTARLAAWVASRGVEMESLDKDTIEEFLHDYDDLPPDVRRALELRAEGAKPSVEKIGAMLGRVCKDGRARGAYLHHGAGQTGRFSSRGVQLHNMPRYRKEFEDAHLDQAPLFQAIRTGEPSALEWLYGEKLGRPLHLLSDAVRGFLWAEADHEFIDFDFSSIEGRFAAWIAGERWKVEAFEAYDRGDGPGMYELTASKIYGIDVGDVSKQQRQTGKVGELACFAAETPVLTSRGLVAIKDVLQSDLLWDGVQWVSHSGVVENGVRRVVNVDGIQVTPSHQILVRDSWRAASELASNESIRSLALATGSASLLSPGMIVGLRVGSMQSASDVRAERQSIPSRSAICSKAPRHAALLVRRRSAVLRARITGVMRTLCRTMRIGADCSTESQLASIGAPTQTTPATRTMEAAASPCTGGVINARIWRIWSHFRGGMTPRLSLIERMSIRATSQATYASSPDARTNRTVEKCKVSKRGSTPSNARMSCCVPVYDILNAGPRNRFTIFSDSGALIVHNCGYEGSIGALAKMARQNKFKLASAFDRLWELTTPERREKALEAYEERLEKHDPRAEKLGRQGWIAAKLIVLGWRGEHPEIGAAWKDLNHAARAAVMEPGVKQFALGGKVSYLVRHGFLWCLLPSGRALSYGRPVIKDIDAPWCDMTLPPEKREKMSSVLVLGVDAQTEKWVRFPIYGGSLFNNVVQGSCRDILVEAMLNLRRAGHNIVLHTHDEAAIEAPRGSVRMEDVEALMCDLPEWTRGLPLTASGWVGKRYRKD